MLLQLVIFFYDCSSLKEIDLSPLSHVTSIGSCFLFCCYNLTEIDLSPFHMLLQLVTYFLYGCTSLMEIDLSPLSHVTSIGNDFLFNCDKLKDIKYTSNNKIIIEKIDAASRSINFFIKN